MPTWLERTSTWRAAGSRQARQSTIPSLREYTATNSTSSGNGPVTCSRASAQHSPRPHSRVNRPGTPAVSSRPSAVTCARTSGWTAIWSTTGEPRQTIRSTRSGRRTARMRAIVPPRLWPVIVPPRPGGPPGALADDRHAAPVALGEGLDLGLEALDRARGAVDVGADPRAAGPVAEV